MTTDAAGAGAPPLLSVVLPVGGVEEYLPACLDSILGQDGPAIEVIAVDDASPDRCGEILDARAAGDKRLRVLHLATAAGPGPARNRGLAEASGEYVWFVDPDDLLAPGALAVVAAVLQRDLPDVLLIDYVLLYPSGRTEPSPGTGLLRAPAGGPTLTLAERPELLTRTMTSWSKVLRRSFLTGLPADFPPGVHEDVPVSCLALLTANRIGLLERVCYCYRQRDLSFLATPSMAHFSIFDSYGRVFAFLAGEWPAVTDAVRAAVFGRAMEHYTTILSAGLIPRHARRDYFRRMADDFQRYRAPGYQPPPGLRGLKLRLAARNAYLGYSLLAPLNSLRVGLRAQLRRMARRRALSGQTMTQPPERALDRAGER